MSFIKFFVKIAVPHMSAKERQLKTGIKEHSCNIKLNSSKYLIISEHIL